jgi:hypothetical protein
MRQAERLFEEIRYVQDMFQVAFTERNDPRRYKIKLVEE